MQGMYSCPLSRASVMVRVFGENEVGSVVGGEERVDV